MSAAQILSVAASVPIVATLIAAWIWRAEIQAYRTKRLLKSIADEQRLAADLDDRIIDRTADCHDYRRLIAELES